MFVDPAGQFSFDIPLRYVYQPMESTLTTVTFRGWDTPSELLGVTMSPTLAPAEASWDDWVGQAASATGLDTDHLTPVRRGQIIGVLATTEDPDEGRHGQTFVARGIRFDIQAQHWAAEGVQDRGPSAALERIWETLDVPANSFLPAMQSQKHMDQLLAKAGQDAMKRPESALQYLEEVRTLAQSMYLYSRMVRGHFPEIPAIQYVVIALAQRFQVTGSMLPLRDAEQLAWRAHTELSSLPVAAEEVADLRGKLQDMIKRIVRMHPPLPGEENEQGWPAPGWKTASMRVIPFGFEMERDYRVSQESPLLAELCEASVRDQLTWQLGQEAALQDHRSGSMTAAEAAQMARVQSRYLIFPNLVSTLLTLKGLRSRQRDLVGSSEASAMAVEVARDPASDAEWRQGCIEADLADPSVTLAKALCLHASSLWDLMDEQSLEDAGTALADAARLADDLADEGELRAQICRQQAGVYTETGRKKEAAEAVERGLRACENVSHPTSAEVSLRLFKARSLLDARNFAEAEATLQDIRYPSGGDQVAARRLRADELRITAQVQEGLGHNEQALTTLALGMATIFQFSPLDEQAIDMLMSASQLEFDRQFKLSVMLNFAAISVLEARRALIGSSEYRVDYGDARQRRDAYAWFAGLLMLVDGAQAMAAADLGRARVLADVLGIRTAPGATVAPGPPPDLDEQAPDDALEKAADYVIQSANQVLRSRGSPPIMTADAVRDLASRMESSVLMIQPFADTLALFLLSPTGEVRTALSDAPLDDVRADLESVNRALHIVTVPRGEADAEQGVGDDREAVLRAALHRLWKALIEPVASSLPDQGPLVVVPYRELTLVPYALLEDGHGTALIDHFAVTVAPSLMILEGLSRRGPYRTRPQRAYLAGNPDIDPIQMLPPLGAALAEVQGVRDRLRSVGLSNGQIMLRHGGSASLVSYRSEARHCDVLHLACHGRLEEPAANSRLYLTPGPSDDGLLLAREVSEVPLDDALVFLSACQTGLGRATADGVIGFGQAFLQAGARVVVGSLWKVNDAATARLAGHFYDALLAGSPNNAATSLQAAMLALRDDLAAGRVIDQNGTKLSADPANWAAFIAFGHARSVSYAKPRRFRRKPS
jgi:CHAT domain-containing protein